MGGHRTVALLNTPLTELYQMHVILLRNISHLRWYETLCLD